MRSLHYLLSFILAFGLIFYTSNLSFAQDSDSGFGGGIADGGGGGMACLPICSTPLGAMSAACFECLGL